MKITKSQLKQIIKEEAEAVLNEAGEAKMRDYVKRAYVAATKLEAEIRKVARPKAVKGPPATTRRGDPLGYKYGGGDPYVGGLPGEIKDLAKATELSISRIHELFEQYRMSVHDQLKMHNPAVPPEWAGPEGWDPKDPVYPFEE